jgi:hypothetical protein
MHEMLSTMQVNVLAKKKGMVSVAATKKKDGSGTDDTGPGRGSRSVSV